jgi:hypothetical protein
MIVLILHFFERLANQRCFRGIICGLYRHRRCACARQEVHLCGVGSPSPNPLAIPTSLSATIPRSVDKKEITSAAPFREAAADVVAAINRILKEMSWTVKRIAVDAPAAAPPTSSRLPDRLCGGDVYSAAD